MRPLHAILALLAFTTFAAASGCGSSAAGSSAACKSDLDCEGGGCSDGMCQPCPFYYYQCVCGGTPVGPMSQDACVVGQGCGLDAGAGGGGGGGGGGGACECVQTTQYWPCT